MASSVGFLNSFVSPVARRIKGQQEEKREFRI
jgi:hypothetical protein